MVGLWLHDLESLEAISHNDEARRIFEKWGLDASVIGRTTTSGRIVLRHGGEVVCDIPLDPLSEDAPLYDRPHVKPEPRPRLHPAEVPPPARPRPFATATW